MIHGAHDLYATQVDPRSINQLLRDAGQDDVQMAKFWEIIGVEISPTHKQTFDLSDLIQRMATVVMTRAEDKPFGAELTLEEFGKIMDRQGLTRREVATLKTAMGWDTGKKKFISILTRMARAIVS